MAIQANFLTRTIVQKGAGNVLSKAIVSKSTSSKSTPTAKAIKITSPPKPKTAPSSTLGFSSATSGISASGFSSSSRGGGGSSVSINTVSPSAPPTPSETIKAVGPSEIGTITNLRHNFVNDEIYVHVTVKNNGAQMQEYRAYLYSASGELVDKENDFGFKNVNPMGSHTFDLTSNYHYFDIHDFGGSYRVSVMTEAGALVDEKVVDLTTGTTSAPADRGTGTIQKPDTAPPTAPPANEKDGFVSNTPPSTAKKAFEIGDLFNFGTGASVGAGSVVVLGLLIYALAKK